MFELGGIRRRDLPSLCALAKHPLPHIGRALDEFNALLLAAIQEPNHPNVDQGNFAQIQNYVSAAITHCRLNADDKVRLNSAAQPQFSHAGFLDPQHFRAHLVARTNGVQCANFEDSPV
jgi:hypothetical protein